MGPIVEKSFGLNIRILQLLLLWPSESYKELQKLLFHTSYAIITLPMPLLAAVHLLVSEDVGLEKFTSTAFMLVQFGCLIFKNLPFVRDSDSLVSCVSMLDSTIFRDNCSTDQERFVKECVSECRRYTRIFAVCSFLSATSWCILPLLEKDYKFQMDLWLPFDVNGPWVYYPIYAYLVVVTLRGAMSNATVDVLTAGLACHAAGQVRILKDNLQNLNRNLEYYDGTIESLRSHQIYKRIIKCVDHHNAIIDFVSRYEIVFSPITFSQLTASVIVICTSCFHLMIVDPNSFSFFFTITYSSIMFTEILIFCFYGTILYEESLSIGTAMYLGQWYDYDVASKKALIVIMTKAQKPIEITSGKILDLSLSTFTTVLKRSYSLLAVLNSFHNN